MFIRDIGDCDGIVAGDNSLLREVLGWEPTTSLRDGLGPTYRWIEKRVICA